MDKFREILLDVWREACRHIELDDAAANIAAMLARHMPLDRLVIRRIESTRAAVVTAAVGAAGDPQVEPEPRIECSPEQMDALVAWCRRRQVAHLADAALVSPAVSATLPSTPEGDVLVGPLHNHGEPAGLLFLVAKAGHAFEPRHEAMTDVLLEPIAVALDNDHRLREIDALREAAEADRRSLLSRLGRKELGDVIIGDDAGLRSVMERVAMVAPSDVPVLLLGETGTGKELLARAIHRRSRRANGPVIRVNCGAIPPELIDSQLFGHERGAFTGAVEARKGWFERADGGTLFLDEIGELPLAAQVRLLRILQDGWFERIGGNHPINVDVRIVAATHRDLAAMVPEGRFREDLWYRLAVFPILVPPLRDRIQDIPILARHFAERAATRFGLPALMPSERDVALLIQYAWPGNVRELGTVMDRAALLGNGRRLEIAKALGVMSLDAAPSPRPQAHHSTPAETASPFPSLDNAMRAHIEAALARTNGRVEGPNGAAALLDINPNTLRARMRKLGVRWRAYRKP